MAIHSSEGTGNCSGGNNLGSHFPRDSFMKDGGEGGGQFLWVNFSWKASYRRIISLGIIFQPPCKKFACIKR